MKLIVLVALADTQTPSNVVAKNAGAKDARTATEEAILAALGVAPTAGLCQFLLRKEKKIHAH